MAPTGIRAEEVSNAAYFKTETKYFANNQNKKVFIFFIFIFYKFLRNVSILNIIIICY